VDPVLGSLVYQLLGGITLAYNLRLGCRIVCWKGIFDKIHFRVSIKALEIIDVIDPKQLQLGPQNGPESLGTEKLLKIVN
jgi:hypothetical protein